MSNLTYPDSLWYTVNNVYYWPYRGWDVSSDPNYKLTRGEYRYFRYNIPKSRVGSPEKKANAACIWLNGMSCYEVLDGSSYFCEGFLEPQCEGVTLQRLIQYLLPSRIEVSTTSVWGIEETLNDLDDFLNLDYHNIHPVTIAGPDDLLLKDNYYPVAAFYKGRNPDTLYRAPTAAEAQSLLLAQGMDLYQPYPTVDPIAISFVLYTANQTPTPRQLTEILLADYVVVNANPLDKEDQEALWRYDRGENMPSAIKHFFESLGRGGARGTKGLGEGVEFLLASLPYLAYAALGGVALYYGAKAYKSLKEPQKVGS